MSDPRKEKFTITLTAEEWDALAFFDDNEHTRLSNYSDHRSKAAHKIGKIIGDPTPRYERAKLEVEALRPYPLKAPTRIKRALRLYIEWWQAGDFEGVSHLGGGCPLDETEFREPIPGFYLSMTPLGVLVLNLREVSFCGRYPYFEYTEDEVAKLLAWCNEIAPVRASWNGVGVSTFSVSFGSVR